MTGAGAITTKSKTVEIAQNHIKEIPVIVCVLYSLTHVLALMHVV